jgi:hypothetical protein
VVSRKETLKFSREFIGLLPCNYPFSTSKRGVTRRQTLSPLPSNTKTQKVEAKWKRNNPLPLAETIIYKGILSVLVEVEANLPKNFQNEIPQATAHTIICTLSGIKCLNND